MSKESVKSKYVQEEIEYSLQCQERKEKIVIPILYKITPKQIPLNEKMKKLLENIYVSLDDTLFNIHKIIPSLTPDYNYVEIPFDKQFHVDHSILIDNLKHVSEEKRKICILINHERFDKQIWTIFKELADKDKFSEALHELDIFGKNFLPLFWINTSYFLSRYIQYTLSKEVAYTMIAKSIFNLFEELLHRLFLHIFDKFMSISIVTSNRSKEMKNRMRSSVEFVTPRGNYDGYFWFMCKIYYDDSITPYELQEFHLSGNTVKRIKAYVNRHNYQSTIQYLQSYPANEILESDWQTKILPQFMSYEIFSPTIDFHSVNDNDLKNTGFDIFDYDKLY